MSVVLYSTKSCPYCIQAKNYLHREGIGFTEYKVDSNTQKAEEMFKKSGQYGVPVLDVNGKILVGFRPEDIQRALKR